MVPPICSNSIVSWNERNEYKNMMSFGGRRYFESGVGFTLAEEVTSGNWACASVFGQVEVDGTDSGLVGSVWVALDHSL